MSSVPKNDWFEQMDEIFFVDIIEALERCWEKCVALDGVSANKQHSNFDRCLLFLCFLFITYYSSVILSVLE